MQREKFGVESGRAEGEEAVIEDQYQLGQMEQRRQNDGGKIEWMGTLLREMIERGVVPKRRLSDNL